MIGIGELRWCGCLYSYDCTGAVGVEVFGVFGVREAQRIYKVQDGSRITYLVYQCNSNSNNTVNSLQI